MAAQTEIHRHLDVSLRTETLLRLAQERGLEAQGTSHEAFREKLVLRQPLSDLNAVLDRFAIFQKVLDRPEVLEQVAFEVIEDCYREGTRRLELRFSPSFVCELSHLPWEDALAGFEAGLRRGLEAYPNLRAGLICIASRDYGFDSVAATVDFYLRNQQRFIGLDLAGNEIDFPCRLFEKPFQKAVALGARLTVHAGEAAGPESVWEAIELLGAQRIGHGLASIRDPLLVEHLRENRICLEMCPTSNWLTGAVDRLESHPLPKLLRAGVPVSINTDDPSVFGVTLPHEIEICKKLMHLSQAEVDRCFEHASSASFLLE